MKVAFVCDLNERWLPLRRLERLVERGVDAHVVVRGDSSAARLDVPPDCIDRVHFCVGKGRIRTAPRQLRSELARLSPQVVHAGSLALAVSCRDAATRAGAKTVASIAGDGVELGGYTGAEAPWDAADAFHFGDLASERLAGRRGLPVDVERAVIAPSADPELLDAELADRSANGGVRIVSVAPLHWSQGLEHAIQGVALAVGRGLDARYTIVGRGEHLPALTFARHQVGIGERVSLVAPDQAVEALAGADIALSAQVVDGLSPGVVRALGAGLPLVVAPMGDLEDASPVPEAAVEVPRRDPRAIADALVRLAADPGMRARMGAAGRERAAARHRQEDELDGLEALYRSVCGLEEPQAAARAPVPAGR